MAQFFVTSLILVFLTGILISDLSCSSGSIFEYSSDEKIILNSWNAVDFVNQLNYRKPDKAFILNILPEDEYSDLNNGIRIGVEGLYIHREGFGQKYLHIFFDEDQRFVSATILPD